MQTSTLKPSKWSLHRRLYLWVLSFAYSKYSTLALFLMSFAESSFFPIAPDVLQIALTIERPKQAWYYAAVSSIASVAGGLAGYAIGALLWSGLSAFFFKYIINEAVFNQVAALYAQWDAWIVFAAAFTPLPYKVFTLAAGVFNISLPIFLIASGVGRSARFFLVAALLSFWGERVKGAIEKYFNVLCILFTLILLGAFLALKYI